MAPSIYSCSPASPACLNQGEIISDLVKFHMAPNVPFSETEPSVVSVKFDLAIVMSQACDLEQDFRSRQSGGSQVPEVLFCQLRTAAELKATLGSNSRLWDRIKINKDERYHFFESISPDCDQLSKGLTELGVDFKRYFTIPTEELYEWISLGRTRRRSVLNSPYLEHLSSRFVYFMSRVALPRDHESA